MKEKSCFLAFCLLILSTCGISQNVDFTKENVNILLDPEHATVSADVSYRNTTPYSLSKLLFYPLPFRTTELKRDTVTLTNITDNSVVRSYKLQRAGVFFMMNFQPEEQKKIRVAYTDDHNGKEVKYLTLTNYQYWNNTISSAGYTVKFDESKISVDSTSYRPESTSAADGMTTMTWKMQNFKPDREFIIYFHKDQ